MHAVRDLQQYVISCTALSQQQQQQQQHFGAATSTHHLQFKCSAEMLSRRHTQLQAQCGA
jgi:hypothetical protein